MKSLLNIASGGANAVVAAMNKSLALIEFDPRGKILTANENFCQAMDYSASELVGQHHRMFLDPAAANSPDYAAFWAKLSGGKFDAGEYKRLAKGGKEVWLQASYNPVFDRKDRVVKVIKIATDITAAKMKAADDGGKIAAILRAQAMIEFSPDGNILSANENFLAVIGYSLNEVAGRHHSIFVDPSEAVKPEYKEFWHRLRSGEFVAQEFRRIGKGGKEVWLQASYNPIFDPDGKVIKVVKFATDITGRIHAVNAIGDGLSRVAAGDLICEIDRPFIPSLDKLRIDFNGSVATLRSALQSVEQNAASIDAAAGEISNAANDLARRTEQQAASIEETAAALEEITTTVQTSTVRAEDAAALVARSKGRAEQSETVVRQAVATMDEIERSSHEVSNITDLMDEIAFQTNLLALNAGVEAARAGEAGKGFAVVAQEVRELAQRSANAAKEIKALITRSEKQVKSGVALVGETGAALQAIVVDVQEINAHVSAIVQAAREQTVGLSEINLAVGVMDQGVQQNAAMVEESSAASAGLASEAYRLKQLLAQFQLVENQRSIPQTMVRKSAA
ncbi:PAS domain-containing methyl-accepting chemotaxis protein (plasmid) [Agrobacterium rosae]|uniref:PAS domain-containing methyl-accepting chemotaxis protein n=1 Tax=Agrobacterium rosae TaxID=1972867 RepID=A0ABU4W4D8_9HYPH|nr:MULTISPECIES: PAS domain-containing methyl-accepting chemotaxis protein [Agrobacterium]MDX8311689.1 PAS domain-containing methyl-accepting chemotaxis protein [Agrobacterium sp. rho-13.3]MDX8332633.1 PAS domain-containing methyl-accepting chemotaxis protein [Agrobacterium rosae]